MRAVRALARWTVRGLGAVVLLASVAVMAVLSPPGERWLARTLHGVLSGALLGDGHTLDPFGLRLDLVPARLTLTDVAFRDPDGAVQIGVGRLDATVDLGALPSGTVRLTGLRLSRVRVGMHTDAGGVLNLVRLFGGPSTEPVDPDAPPWGGLPVRIEGRDVALRDGMVWLWGPPDADGVRAGFEARVIDLIASDVVLPAHDPGVRVDVGRVGLDGVLLAPGPLPLSLDGGFSWTGTGVLAEGLSLRALGTRLGVDGRAEGLTASGDLDVALTADPVDLSLLDGLFGAPVAGRYAGTLRAAGTFAGLAVDGALTGVDGARGALALAPGSTVCLPGYPSAADACGALPGGAAPPSPAWPDPGTPPLRWTAGLDLDGFALEDVLPVVGGPLRLEGSLRARGGGTGWPDGVRVDEARWKAADLDMFGVRLREVDTAIGLRRGVLSLDPVHVSAVGASLDGRASLDLVRGTLSVDAQGPLRPAWLADVGVPDVGGTGWVRATVTGDVFAPGAPIAVDATLKASDLDAFGVQAGSARAGAAVTVRDGVVDVEATVDAGPVDAYGAFVHRVEVPSLAVRVAEGATRVVVRALAPDLFHDVGVHVADLDTEITVEVPVQGDPTVVVSARVGPQSAWGLVGRRGRARFGMAGDVIGLDLTLDAADGPFVHVDGLRYDLLAQRLDVSRLHLGLRQDLPEATRQEWVSTRALRVVLAPDGLSDVDVGLSLPRGGRLDLRGRAAQTGPLGLVGSVDGLGLDLFDALFPAASLGLGGVVGVRIDAQGAADDPIAQIDVDVSDVRVDGLLAGLHARGSVGVTAELASVEITAGTAADPSVLKLDGTLPVNADLASPGLRAAGPVSLRAAVSPGAWSRFGDVVPSLTGLPEGRLSGVFAVGGDLADPDLDVQFNATAAVAGLRHPTRMEVDLRRRAGALALTADLYDGVTPLLLIDGKADTRLGEVMDWLLADGPTPELSDAGLYASDLDVTARLSDVDVDTVQQLAGLDLAMDGRIAGEVTVRGEPMRPVVGASIDAALDIDDTPVPISLCVRPPVRGGATGLFGAGLRVRQVFALRAAAAAVDGCEARLASHRDPDTYGIHLEIGPSGWSWLVAHGGVPIQPDLTQPFETWGTTAFDVDVTGEGVPLAVFAALDPEIRASVGALRAAGRLEGSLTNPEPRIEIAVDQGDVSYRPLGLRAADLSVRGRIVPSGTQDEIGALDLIVDSVTARTRPLRASLETVLAGSGPRDAPTVQGEARLHLSRWLPDALSAQITLSDAWLMATERNRARVDGGVTVGGVYPALDVQGALKVTQGRVELDTSDLLAARDLAVAGNVRICRGAADGPCTRFSQDAPPPAPPPEVAPEEEAPGLYESMVLAVSVDLGRALQTRLRVPVLDDLGSFGAQLTRADIDARLGGALDVSIREGQLSLVGDVELLQGRVQILRSRFDLQEGSRITFLGEDYANPQLDIGGVMAVTGGDVKLDLEGTPASLDLRLSSEDFGSDAQLFTILLTGQAPDDLSSREGEAAAQALGDLLLNSVLGGVNLGSVSVEGDGTVRLGVPVTRAVFVESTFDPVPRLNENRIEVAGEWSILPRLLLTAAYGDRRVRGGLSWELRFDGPRRERLRAEREAASQVDDDPAPDDEEDPVSSR